jgi:hypothetical protein
MVPGMDPDVLYAVRHGERNEALRYSLRSLGNLPHRRVFVSGHCPEWVRGVTVIPASRRANKFDSIEENVREGLRHPEIAEHVVYMNDDFYVTRPVDRVPATHGGTIDQHNGQQELAARMRRTRHALRDHFPEPHELFTYDGVHMPLPLERELARPILEWVPSGLLWRTWYGNVSGIGGDRVPNAKYKGAHPPPAELPTYLSTNNHGLQMLRAQLEDALPKGSPYV